MRKERLPRGFGQPPKFYGRLPAPDGAKETLRFVIENTPAGRRDCPYSIKAIAELRRKRRETISLHLAYWGDLGQIRLVRVRRGDSRSFKIIICFREQAEDLLSAIDKQIESLPEKAMEERSLRDFKAERRAKKTSKGKTVKETKGEYVA